MILYQLGNSRSFVSQACSGYTPMSQYSMLQRVKFVGEVALTSSKILAVKCLQNHHPYLRR